MWGETALIWRSCGCLFSLVVFVWCLRPHGLSCVQLPPAPKEWLISGQWSRPQQMSHSGHRGDGGTGSRAGRVNEKKQKIEINHWPWPLREPGCLRMWSASVLFPNKYLLHYVSRNYKWKLSGWQERWVLISFRLFFSIVAVCVMICLKMRA